MGYLPEDEIRRLVSYLRPLIQDVETLAAIEDELRSEDAEEFLREPDLLNYFPALIEKLLLCETNWQLRVIPHARLRMVQRGISWETLLDLFRRFVEYAHSEGFPVLPGPYAITGWQDLRSALITLRLDIDVVDEGETKAHVVTLVFGRSESGSSNVIEV